MSKLVVLSFGGGRLESGFPVVTVQVWNAHDPLPIKKLTGALPPAPEILEIYHRWKRLYQALQHRLKAKPRIQFVADDITNVSKHDFEQICQQFQHKLNGWLQSEPFRIADLQLHSTLSRDEEIRVVVETDDVNLCRLPWHLWSFFETFSHAEVAFSIQNVERPQRLPEKPKSKIKVLAILGNRDGIDTQADQLALGKLKDAEITFLVEPSRQDLTHQLWEQGWQILFFAGHSFSEADGEAGRICINATESLAIAHLRHGLQAAIRNGLKLAIFNSCEGLGLAQELADLYIPQMIVMRERVPDKIAQQFLKAFLPTFSSGQSFYSAVREARERLQSWEEHYPCASWLPVIFQNSTEESPTWQKLLGRRDRTDRSSFSSHLLPRQRWIPFWLTDSGLTVVLLISLLMSTLTVGIRFLGMLEPIELSTFDLMMRMRPPEAPDDRILLIEVTDEDVALQRQRGDLMRRQSTSAQTRNQPFDISLSDRALNQLLTLLLKHRPRVIGLDVYRDFPVEQRFPELKTQLQNQSELFVICKAEDFNAPNILSVDPPPEISSARTGFSDFQADQDGILRRHLLGMLPVLRTPDSRCNSDISFSTRIAFDYLRRQGIQADFAEHGNLQLNGKIYPILTSHTGGYHRLREGGGGSQIMLNYRSTPTVAERITLGQILSNQINPAYIEDKIVLIGITAGADDDWATPYGTTAHTLTPGVEVHAHMISQLVNAALEDRPLIWTRSLWQDGIWIFTWATLGGVLTWTLKKPERWIKHLLIYTVVVFLIIPGTLYGFCFLLLLRGGWVPFIPSLLALILTSGVVKTFSAFKSHLKLTSSPKS